MMIKSVWNKLKDRMKRWLKACREETHDHYPCYLPERIGFFSSFILGQFYSGIDSAKEQLEIIRNLPGESIVVYVTKRKSYFEYLFYHTRYKQKHLPYPGIGFDYHIWAWQPLSRILGMVLSLIIYIYHNKTLPDPYHGGYYRYKLLDGQAAMLSLVGKKSFYRRFVKAKTDPIRHLIEIQQTLDRPVYIVPQLMFFGKTPLRSVPSLFDILFGPEASPGILRRLFILFRNPGKVFIEVSEPVNLKLFLEQAGNRDLGIETLSLNLRKKLLVQINRHRQSITGPVLKSREELKESILTGNRLRGFIEYYSKKHDMPIYKVRKKADGYVDEIAAKYNAAVIKILAVIVEWITRSMFDGVTVNREMLSKVKSMSQKSPLILIPCHKSHIDYLILAYLFYSNNMPCPHIAAGKNLSFWPLGPIFRAAGAFFIRRSFKGASLYTKVFSEYIRKLLEEGFNIEFFIEGGRSRTGKMILPKLGLLSTLINAYKDGACKDMIFVPIYIGYDRVLEENAYLSELEGGKKEPENLLQVIKARKVLKKRYGKIYIKFHEPISFNELLAQMEIRMEDLSSKEQNALCRNLGHRVINSINEVTVVTPHAVVACAILNMTNKRFSFDDLEEHIETYMNYLSVQQATLAETLIIDQTGAIERVIDTYVQRKFVERISLGAKNSPSDDVYTVNESKRPNLEYYKNNCIAFFIPAAFTSLAILGRDAFQFTAAELHDSYSFQQKLFKDEFAYDVDQSVEYFIRKNIKAFIDDAILMPHPTLPDTYNLTSAGFRKLKLFSVFLKTYFESYWIVLSYFRAAPQKSVSARDRMKRIEALGNRMYKKEAIEKKEALSEVNYKNAVKFFTSRGITGQGNAEKFTDYTDAVQRYLSLLNS